MREFLFIVILSFLLESCYSVKIIGNKYNSICRLQNRVDVILKIDDNNIFQYFFAYNDEVITGNWSIENDTLMLFSPKFIENPEELSPITKKTNLDNLDKYLIKGRKLYVINKEGVQKHCYLVRVR